MIKEEDIEALEAKFGLVKVPVYFGLAFVTNAKVWESQELKNIGLSGYFMDCDKDGKLLRNDCINVFLNFRDRQKPERWLKCSIEMLLSVDKPLIMQLINDYATKQQSFQ